MPKEEGMDFRTIIIASACSLLFACGPVSSNNGNNGDSNSDVNSSSNGDANSSTNGDPNSDANSGTNGGTVSCNESFGAADACGGDADGTWELASTCSDFDYATLIEDACPDATVNDVTYDLTGELAVSAGNWAYTLSGDVIIDASIPQSCSEAVGGCAAVQAALEGVAESAACMDAASGCDCTATFDGADSSAGTYTASDGVATIDNGDEWYFCVEGDSLTLREKTDEQGDHPVFVLTK
jgi:hypothetical protein